MAKGNSLNKKRMFFKKSNLGTSERTDRAKTQIPLGNAALGALFA